MFFAGFFTPVYTNGLHKSPNGNKSRQLPGTHLHILADININIFRTVSIFSQVSHSPSFFLRLFKVVTNTPNMSGIADTLIFNYFLKLWQGAGIYLVFRFLLISFLCLLER